MVRAALEQRRTIAEEHHWRSASESKDWYPEECHPPSWMSEKEFRPVLAEDPLMIAAIYVH
jgi:hypothetical protein